MGDVKRMCRVGGGGGGMGKVWGVGKRKDEMMRLVEGMGVDVEMIGKG